MSETAIKFCGITRAEDARLASAIGAAYVGCIFADSARRVSADDARSIFRDVASARKVGVFGDEPAAEILAAADASGVDVIQLHAGADADMLEELRAGFRGEIWTVIRVGGDRDIAEAIRSAAGDAILLDTHSDSRLGGTGRAFDWEREADGVRAAIGERRLVVAGGLTPENVAAAVRALRPDVVDVSTGVESSPGVKNSERMRAFAAAVEAANGK